MSSVQRLQIDVGLGGVSLTTVVFSLRTHLFGPTGMVFSSAYRTLQAWRFLLKVFGLRCVHTFVPSPRLSVIGLTPSTSHMMTTSATWTVTGSMRTICAVWPAHTCSFARSGSFLTCPMTTLWNWIPCLDRSVCLGPSSNFSLLPQEKALWGNAAA